MPDEPRGAWQPWSCYAAESFWVMRRAESDLAHQQQAGPATRGRFFLVWISNVSMKTIYRASAGNFPNICLVQRPVDIQRWPVSIEVILPPRLPRLHLLQGRHSFLNPISASPLHTSTQGPQTMRRMVYPPPSKAMGSDKTRGDPTPRLPAT